MAIYSLVQSYLRKRVLKLFEAKPKKPIKKPWLMILASEVLLYKCRLELKSTYHSNIFITCILEQQPAPQPYQLDKPVKMA
jgi:hypothetical protein